MQLTQAPTNLSRHAVEWCRPPATQRGTDRQPATRCCSRRLTGNRDIRACGPIVFAVMSRYHGGAYAVFSNALNENMVVLICGIGTLDLTTQAEILVTRKLPAAI